MENEVCTTCGGPVDQGDHNHGDAAATTDDAAQEAPEQAPAADVKAPWWKFW